MLWAVFLGGCDFSFLPAGADSSNSSESEGDFLFLALAIGSGDECDDIELARPLSKELGLWWRLGVEAGGGGATKPCCSNREGEKRALSAVCWCWW